jgi:hypothetical protein
MVSSGRREQVPEREGTLQTFFVTYFRPQEQLLTRYMAKLDEDRRTASGDQRFSNG